MDEREQAIAEFEMAVARALVESPEIGAAQKRLESAGLRVHAIDLGVHVVETGGCWRPSPAQSDADFLRSLRIDPNLKDSEP